MDSSPSETVVPFIDTQGIQHGAIRIVARSSEGLFALSPVEAAARGEESVQILEGHTYEYELIDIQSPTLTLRETTAIQPSRLMPKVGRIEPGLATGMLPIVLEDWRHEEVARARIEVRSIKLDYHSDYRHMLDYIAEVSVNLLMDIHAPSQARISSAETVPASTLHERFAFLRYLLTDPAFEEAMHRILSMPHHRSMSEVHDADIRRPGKASRALARAISKGGHRVSLPTSHPVHREMQRAGVITPSLPRTVSSQRSEYTRDIPENRFVKFALTDFLNVLLDIEERLSAGRTGADLRLLQEVRPLKRSIAGLLGADLFNEVGNATVLPLGSPVLQRRSGYRELLDAWIRFNLAAQLTWAGGDNVFGGGKKDVALLYEYWLFFFLLDVISEELRIEFPVAPSLLAVSNDGFDVRLKSGTSLSLAGTHDRGGRLIRVRFSYNRTFSGKPANSGSTYPSAGSWTRAMRPDFTLSLWPGNVSEGTAEEREEIVHLHFDAKYRIESITGLFGTDTIPDSDDEDDGRPPSTVRPRRSDLLKMHAYRDAIRRTEGAYVLYPGPASGNHAWTEYHEIIPGLGAFAVRPGHEGQARLVISEFIRNILTHMSDHSTTRERVRRHRRRVQEAHNPTDDVVGDGQQGKHV